MIIHHKSAADYFSKGKVYIKPFPFDVPANLALFTSRDSEGYPSLFEKQMAFHNCNDYKEIFITFSEKEKAICNLPPVGGLGINTRGPQWVASCFRIRYHLDYIKSKECLDKEYVLFADASDILFLRSPAWVLDSFINEYNKYDLIYNATSWKGGHYGYDHGTSEENLKSAKAEALSSRNQKGKYLNAGLLIGKKDLLIDVYEKALEYVTDDLEIIRELIQIRSAVSSKEHLAYWEGPKFPLGCLFDQPLIRHIQWDFPRLGVDFEEKIFCRCHPRDMMNLGMVKVDDGLLSI
jgi:hypothetical protein